MVTVRYDNHRPTQSRSYSTEGSYRAKLDFVLGHCATVAGSGGCTLRLARTKGCDKWVIWYNLIWKQNGINVL